MVFFGGALFQLIICIAQDMRKPASNPHYDTIEKLFYNNPEENERREEAIRSRSFFQSLLTNAGLVLIVLLCYWLCLSFQVF